jgi:DNA polymerase V
MAYFISEAAYNMRRKNVKTKLITLFLARKNHGNDREYIKYDFSDHKFITATNDTFNLTKAGEKLLCSLYRKNELYKKLGVIFSDLQKETTLQYSIFDIFESDNKIKKVNNIIDNINDKYGYGTLRIGTCD